MTDRTKGPMTMRTVGKTVTFLHPFRLSGADELQPAGAYIVETDEELLQALSFPAYRRLSTYIRLPGRPGSSELARVVNIDPAELAVALATDAQTFEAAAALPQRTAAAAHGSRRSATAFVVAGCKRWVALNATELKLTALVVGSVVVAGLFASSTRDTSGLP